MNDLKRRFFRDPENFDATKLTSEEYDYYFNYLAEARSNTVNANVIYFDKKVYSVVQGHCRNSYNQRGELIANRFRVEHFTNIAVKDDLLEKLVEIFKTSKNIFTNIQSQSILFRKIAIYGDWELMRLPSITDIDKSYEDLIGMVESQKNFFINPTFFREQVNLIHQSEGQKIPSSILALIHWFSLYR